MDSQNSAISPKGINAYRLFNKHEFSYYYIFYLFNIHFQGLYDEINRNEVKLNNLNNTGEFLISQSTNCNQLKDTLDRVNQNWDITMNKMNSRKLGYVY